MSLKSFLMQVKHSASYNNSHFIEVYIYKPTYTYTNQRIHTQTKLYIYTPLELYTNQNTIHQNTWPATFHLKENTHLYDTKRDHAILKSTHNYLHRWQPGPTFIKPDQLDPWIKDQIKITLLPTISHLLLPNFVSCGRACPSHRTQNLVTVGTKLLTGEWFSFDPWSMDQDDLVW